MNKFSFLFLVFFYALGSLFTLLGDITVENQIIGSLILITIFGIPHGSIDNIILLTDSAISPKFFYFGYICTIVTYIFFWVLFPFLSFIFFLIISSYHFGESQLANYKIKFNLKKILYFVWGVSLMSTLFHYNSNELFLLFNLFDDTQVFSFIFSYSTIKIIFYLSNTIFLIGFTLLFLNDKINRTNFSSEIFQLALLHISFYLFPVIISFTLYFIFLHSLKVLTQEYAYLKTKFDYLSFFYFIKMLFPHTIIALIFVCLFFVFNDSSLDISVLLFSFISLSVITLPHSLVMTRFYDKFKSII